MYLGKVGIIFLLIIGQNLFSQQVDFALQCQIEHEYYSKKEGIGLLSFDVIASVEGKHVYGGATLGSQNSVWRLDEDKGDARFYGEINRLRLGVMGGVYLLNGEFFKWSIYTNILQGFAFQKRTPYTEVVMAKNYRLQLQPGMKFQFDQFTLGFHYGYNLVNDFNTQQGYIVGGSVGIAF